MMNDFDIEQSRMLGYWLEDAPVRTNHSDVLATTYVRPSGVLVALASWSDEDIALDLSVDLSALGVGGDVRTYAPPVDGLQSGRPIDLSSVTIPAGQGLFLRIDSAGQAN